MAKNISIKDRKVRIQMWDTAGQEAYRSITRSYYKSAACVFIVYDISDKKSFMDVDIWLKDCRDICFKSVLIYLIGNKSDLEENRQVSKEQGEEKAISFGCAFLETSAMNGSNIDKAFNLMIKEIFEKFSSDSSEDKELGTNVKGEDVKLDKVKDKNKKKCC